MPERKVLRAGRHAATVALYFMYYNFGRVHQNAPRDASNGSWHRGSRPDCVVVSPVIRDAQGVWHATRDIQMVKQ
jgi:hypothetical protein